MRPLPLCSPQHLPCVSHRPVYFSDSSSRQNSRRAGTTPDRRPLHPHSEPRIARGTLSDLGKNHRRGSRLSKVKVKHPLLENVGVLIWNETLSGKPCFLGRPSQAPKGLVLGQNGPGILQGLPRTFHPTSLPTPFRRRLQNWGFVFLYFLLTFLLGFYVLIVSLLF